MGWLRIVAVTVLVTSCTGSPDTSVPPDRSTDPAGSPIRTLPPKALPVPDPTPWPMRPGDERDRPTTSDVPVGRARPFKLYTHCGIDFRVDFDASFWQSYRVGDDLRIGNPFQGGTMTLLSDEVAVFRYESDQGEISVFFVRNDTPTPKAGCF